MANRNKTRLYITLQYRLNGGFHWALLLTPKTPSKDQSDSYYMHATNSIMAISSREAAATDNLRQSQNSSSGSAAREQKWQFIHAKTNVFKSSTLIGKVLVAKCGAQETLLQHAEYMVRLFDTILAPDRSLDGSWNCISFVGEALALLQNDGKYGKIPQLTDEVIAKIEEFGQKELKLHQATAVLNPNAILDIRGD